MQKIGKIISFIIAITLSACSSKVSNYVSEDGFAQGSTYHIVYEIPASANDAQAFQLSVKDSIELYFDQINKAVSGYDSTSILSGINRGENPVPNKIFIDVFNYAKQIYKESNGAVDASAAPLFEIWGFGFKNGVKIDKEKIDSIKQFIGMDGFHISPHNMLIKDDPRLTLNFNAIAQGYTADYFAMKFDAMGINNYLLEIGGEIFCKGVNSKGRKWRVGIDKPVDGNFIPGKDIQAIIELSGRGLVTSGNYRKFYITDEGEKLSHTIDPKSGYPVKHSLLSATVIAENATIADGYATYFMVVGLERAKEILAATPNMEALLIYGEEQNMKSYETPGLREMLVKDSK
ncbi:MAG: FAD:protein FMN transferase [Bacteroidales bacterium]|nr:FAD:protein FMN transferase [Bacteroidales bacterium]